MAKREGRRQRSIQSAVVSRMSTIQRVRASPMSPSMIVTFFPRCLQGISSKSWSDLFCSCCFPVRDFVDGEILKSERIKDRMQEDCEGGSKRVWYWWGHGERRIRAARWRLCDAKDSCGCATICEGWVGVAEEGDDDEKGTRVVDKVIVSLAKAVSGGSCGVGRKLAGGCIMSRCSTGGATISSALQITFLSTVISDRMWHPLQNTLRKSHDQWHVSRPYMTREQYRTTGM